MDKSGFLEALTAYSRNPCPEIPAILEQYLNGIASNGETLYHWPLLKPLLFAKMEQVIGELEKEFSSEVIPERPNVENVPFDVMHARIVEAFHKFNGAPFTIQRLCELLIDPKRHYKRSDKFLRGLEKNVLVVSTVDPFGRNVVSEIGNKHLVNGMDTVGSPFFPRDSSITSNLPPIPGWVTSAPSVTSPQSVVPTARSHQKQSQESAVTTSMVSGAVVTSLYGEQPQASQTEDVVEETVVTMDTSESSVPDSRDTGSEEEGMGREDSNTSSSSSSSSEELSTNDTSDNSPDVPATTTNTDTPHTSPWVSVVAEGENKVHVSPSDASHDDQCGGVAEVGSSSEPDKSESETPPSRAVSDGQADSFLSSSEVNSSSPSETESGEKPSLHVDSSSSEVPMETSCMQQDSYNDSTGFDTAFTSEEVNTLEHSAIRSGSEDSSGVSSEAPSMDTTPPGTDTADSPVQQTSQTVDSSSHSEITISSDVSSKDVPTPASKDELTFTSSTEKPDCSLDSAPSSPPTLPVDLSATLPSSASRSQRMNPSSPDSPSDCQEPQAKRRKLSHEPSHADVSSKTSTDVIVSSDFPVSTVSGNVLVSSDFPVSSNTSGDVTASSDFPVSSDTSGDVTVSSDFPASSSMLSDGNASPEFPVLSNTPGDGVTVLSDFTVSSNTPGDVVTVSSDFPVSSNTPGDVVTVSSDFSVSSNTPGDVVTVSSDFPVSSNTPGDVVTVSSDFPVSSNTPGDVVTVLSDFPVSSNTSGEVTVSPDSDSTNTASGSPVDPAWVHDTHDGPVDSEPAVHDDDSEGRECVASPPSQEASSSDSQGFDATVESQHMDTAVTNVEESAKLVEFDKIEEFKKTEEPAKEKETTEGNLTTEGPQN